ncbi:alpha/beta fold hydrolase [Pararhizobium arenae]|uniref:alpha/beta fold hydrolase n=1 Tax=Pararhizobium arenae TaxID=1856850 RepID=UPI0009FA222D
MRPGLAKQIVWSDPVSRRKTDVCIVYVHGFSASSGEVRPLPDIVAQACGANLLYTRLSGHGRSSEAMAQATIEDWRADVVEAIAIGEQLGEQIILMATSTGATLCAEILAGDHPCAKRIKAAIFLAPNFGLRALAAPLLTGPFARQLAHLLLGRLRSFKPINTLHATYWTNDYPVDALLPMARLVKEAGMLACETARIPTLFVVSGKDRIIDPAKARRVASRWGGPTDIIDPGDVGDPYGHVPAGDALSPSTTKTLSEIIIKWIRKLI